MKIIPEISYHKTYGERGLGDLYLPKTINAQTPLALAIHGGAWCSMNKYSFSGVARFLCSLGFAVYNIQYRLTTIAPWPACGDDCMEAANFFLHADIPEFTELNRKKLLIVGASAGGHLALMTGLRLPPEKVSGIVSISGVDDLTADIRDNRERYSMFFAKENFSEEMVRLATPSTYLKPDSPPILITHAIYDTVVPLESATVFEDAARAVGAPIQSYYYNRKNDGHCIWIPGSDPHTLHKDIENRLQEFLQTRPHSPA